MEETSETRAGRLRSPLNYFGSKSRIASRIVKHFPVHHTFVDVFGGSASVLLAKPPSLVEVYNDTVDLSSPCAHPIAAKW